MSQGITELKRNGHYYFIKCPRESHKQEHAVSKINVSPLANVHRFHFSVKNLPSQVNSVRAYLEITSPEEMAEAPFQRRRAKSVNEPLIPQIPQCFLKLMSNTRFVTTVEMAVIFEKRKRYSLHK